MTFVQYLLLFLVAPAALLLAAQGAALLRTTAIATVVIGVVALVLSAPLMAMLVHADVLVFDPDKLTATIWRIPYEALALVALEAVFAVALAVLVLRRRWWSG